MAIPASPALLATSRIPKVYANLSATYAIPIIHKLVPALLAMVGISSSKLSASPTLNPPTPIVQISVTESAKNVPVASIFWIIPALPSTLYAKPLTTTPLSVLNATKASLSKITPVTSNKPKRWWAAQSITTQSVSNAQEITTWTTKVFVLWLTPIVKHLMIKMAIVWHAMMVVLWSMEAVSCKKLAQLIRTVPNLKIKVV